MPWTVADVDKHKKGLTPAQKKKWVTIANSALKQCQTSGGSDCEGKAIRIANSKFSFDDAARFAQVNGELSISVPSSALVFEEDGAQAKVTQFTKEEGDPEDKLEMIAYSGGIIKGHWYWGDLAIDLEGMKFPKKTYPILEAHDTSCKIAFTQKPKIVDNALHIDPDKTTFVDTEESLEFRKLSKQGFPYQSSISAQPTKIQRLMENEVAEVNGYSMKGPVTIWRESEFKEVSVCVFGYDSNTSSKAFSKDEDAEMDLTLEVTGFENQKKGEPKKMTLEELKAQHPELVSEIEKDVTIKFTDEKQQIQTQFSTELEAVKKEVQDLRTENQDLRKRDVIRTEAENFAKSEAIWDRALASSEVPENLRDKVRTYVDHTKFVKDSVLNIEEFTKAVQDEIKDWETKFTEAIASRTPVEGVGTLGRRADDGSSPAEEFTKDDEDWLNSMTKFVQ